MQHMRTFWHSEQLPGRDLFLLARPIFAQEKSAVLIQTVCAGCWQRHTVRQPSCYGMARFLRGGVVGRWNSDPSNSEGGLSQTMGRRPSQADCTQRP